jgi:hypothetical protein
VERFNERLCTCHRGQIEMPEYSITFVPFIEWLNEQEQGSIFTMKEEVELRAADRELTEHNAAAAQKQVSLFGSFQSTCSKLNVEVVS